ncbi:hypothetical protein [Brevundimonas sp. Root1423]|uniref:hypothetical protein n=1 Tax=Brevundimonas sp. Root1423 TaxID=1736462 RepID=UPI0006F3A607|nr:hypothetical protein [Brevundimonas sp. Root1423]KQY80375.1 hypothetical protein ASD25_09520 [Brevundimonas sp. Root1423]
MTSLKLIAASAAALTLVAGAASAQTPYGSTPYGQSQTQTDPIGAILGALFGDRLGVSTTLDSEWGRGRRPLNTNRAQFESRLDADVRSGAISSSAARSLTAEYNELVTIEARYTADGRVTTTERSDLAERYRAFSTRYQAGGQGGYDDGYDDWRPLADSRVEFNSRLDAGVRNRTLTRSQANRLSTDFNALVQLETTYERNGIDSRERQDLEARWADLNRRVGDNYDGGYTPGDNYGSDPRGAQIEARISAGERNGSISRTEASSLRLELRDLTRRWTELEARVSAASR